MELNKLFISGKWLCKCWGLFVMSFVFLQLVGKTKYSQNVEQMSHQGKDHQETPSAGDLQCLRYVRSVADSGV